MQELSGLSDAARERAMSRFRLIEPYLEERRSLQANGNHGKSATHDRQELKPVHVWHPQIGDDDVRKRLFESSQTFKAIFRAEVFVTLPLEHLFAKVAQAGVVVNN